MLKKYTYICIYIIFLFSGNVCFPETQLGLGAFTVNPDSKIEITSNSMVFNSKTQFTEFYDKVVIKYGNLTLEAVKLKISQSSKPSQSESLEFYIDGPLVIYNGKNSIYGDTAFYSRKDQNLTISGNVHLSQGNNKISGEQLVLNLDNGLAKISGSVKTILEPVGKN